MREGSDKAEEKEGSRFVRGMKVVDICEEERGERNGFLVTFEDGQQIWAQIVVGADGSRSLVSINTTYLACFVL